MRFARGWKPLKAQGQTRRSGQNPPGGLGAWFTLVLPVAVPKAAFPVRHMLIPTPPMAEKPKKPQKLRARLPRGLADRGPAESAATRRMTATISEGFERYGFEPVETPALEYTGAFGKFLPDQDRPNEVVFYF